MTFPVIKTTKSAKKATPFDLLSYDYFLDVTNLYNGYLHARKLKRKKKAIMLFENSLGLNLEQLKYELETESYCPSNYRTFCIFEPKQRTVVAPDFRDSVIQHTIYNYIYELFDSTFIYDSYGCRKNKGTHKASARLQTFMRKCSSEDYYLQLDISKYYYRINHSTLEGLIYKHIKDDRLVKLIMMFVNIDKGIGLYIGNILSQLFGLIYLNKLDHYVKRRLRQKFYLRYVDDFVIVGVDKQTANLLKDDIVKFLHKELQLSISKFRIAKIKHGCNFVGFRTWQDYKLVRKHTLRNFKKAVKNQQTNSIISILGHASHSSSHRHLIKLLEKNNAIQI